MARLQGTGRIAAEAVAAATVETLIQLVAAANHRLAIVAWSVSGHGTSNTDEPGTIDLLRQTTSGTASALSLVQDDDSIAETIQTTAQQDFTAEPTAGNILRTVSIHPQSGYEKAEPFSREPIVGGGDRMGVRANYTQAQTLDAWIAFEE